MKTEKSTGQKLPRTGARRPIYPFSAIVGQEEMKLALLLNAIDPAIGGVLIMGHRGTGKSTAVRALADLLPATWRVRGCLYGCDPEDIEKLCDDCAQRLEAGEKLHRERAPVSVVDLPLGATEDRVCGSINIERALTEGVKAFEAGLLARANRGFLYVDEVNLLEDHLVDLLLDAAATGRNRVERESVSIEHPSQFVLIGSGNPEEGELRPQLLDRFGLHVDIRTIDDVEERLLIVERRDDFERDPSSFCERWESEQESLRRKIARARRLLQAVVIERATLRRIAELCLSLNVDGHRGELTLSRAARALAAFEGRRSVTEKEIERVAVMSLRHRLRRDPLDQTPGGTRIEQALEKIGMGTATESGHKRNARDNSGPKDFDDDAGKTAVGSVDGQKSGGLTEQAQTEHGARLPENTLDLFSKNSLRKQVEPSGSSRRQSGGHKASYNRRRGRYTRAVAQRFPEARIALDATLRAAATEGVVKEDVSKSRDVVRLTLSRDALRYKLFKRKAGSLFIFAVDTSGSMASNRIRQAKGALTHLLERSYIRRDRVALVHFQNDAAEILLTPSRSAVRARRLLDALPVGGATPLAAGLVASLNVATRARLRDTGRTVLLLFTDGRANVGLNVDGQLDRRARSLSITKELGQLGAALKCERIETVLVDTQSKYTSNGEGRALASLLGAHYVYLPPTGNVQESFAGLSARM